MMHSFMHDARQGTGRPWVKVKESDKWKMNDFVVCLIYSTGCPSSSGSCSVLVPWSGGVSWVLLRPTSEIFAVPPRAPEIAVHSAHRNRGYSLFLLLVHLQPRPVHSRWLAPLYGMGFLCRKRLLPMILSHTFYSSLKTLLYSRARIGSASSNLEGALYKSP